jgi:hypothetical protein
MGALRTVVCEQEVDLLAFETSLKGWSWGQVFYATLNG